MFARGAPRYGVSSMPQAQSFYERQLELTWWFVMARIGQDLREQYEVPKELPPKLLRLVRRLDDSDVVFWENQPAKRRRRVRRLKSSPSWLVIPGVRLRAHLRPTRRSVPECMRP